MIVSLFSRTIQLVYATGISMAPTHDRDSLEFCLSTKIVGIKRGDIVSLKTDGLDTHESITKDGAMKRIVGVPGDLIEVKQGVVYVNGEKDPYGTEVSEEFKEKYYYLNFSLTLGDDEYFVCGDNRNHSYDSRFFNLSKTVSSKQIEAVDIFTLLEF